MSDSEDLPPLVYSSDEEEGPLPKQNSNKKQAKSTQTAPPVKVKTSVRSASMWVGLSKEELTRQEHVIKVYTMAPFMFGQVNQPDFWTENIKAVGLMEEDPNPGTIKPSLSHVELEVVDHMERATNIVIEQLRSGLGIKSMVDLMGKMERMQKLEDVLDAGFKDRYIEMWRGLLKGPKRMGTMALLFATRQYVEHMVAYTKRSRDMAAEYEEDCKKQEQQTEDTKQKGNTEFTIQNYKKAISQYTNAVYRSPYNHILYSNRAQAYLKDNKFKEALCDGKRAILLKPDWPKGHYRLAQAYFELGETDKARAANAKGLEWCAKDKDLQTQKNKFWQNYQGTGGSMNNNSLKTTNNGLPSKSKSTNTNAKVTSNMHKTNSTSEYDTVRSNNNNNKNAENGNTGTNGVHRQKSEDSSSEDDDDNDDGDDDDDDDGDDGDDGIDSDDGLPDLVPSSSEDEKEFDSDSISDSASDHEEYERKQDEYRKKMMEEKRRKEEQKRKLEEEKKKKKEKEKQEAEEKEKREKKAEEKRKREAMKLQNTVKIKTEAEKLLESRQSQLDTNLKQGSKEYLAGRAIAQVYLNRALDMIVLHTSNYFAIQVDSLIVIKYTLGSAYVDIGNTDADICEGLKQFNSILKKHKDFPFPLAFFGLGRGYIKQNRYYDALVAALSGLKLVTTSALHLAVYCWPNTSTIINETRPGNMKVAFEHMINVCHNPPPPDAVCRYNHCSGHYKIQIYFNDPDFKGFVRVKCVAKCVVEYHSDCWKKMKASMPHEKITDKDLIQNPCFTPDCGSTIWNIIIFDSSGGKTKEFSDPSLCEKRRQGKKKCAMKIPASNASKIARKMNRKQVRLQRKKEEKERKAQQQLISQLEKLEQLEDNPADSQPEGGESGSGVVVLEPPVISDLSRMVALKKDESGEDELYKVRQSHKSKSKKKKHEKTKPSDKVKMSLGEFVGDPEEGEDLEGATAGYCPQTPELPPEGKMGLDDFDEVKRYQRPVLDAQNPFVVPEALQEEVEAFESSYGDMSTKRVPWKAPTVVFDTDASQPVNAVNTVKDIKETIFSFFADFLREHGPLHVADTVILQEVENFPVEAQRIIEVAGGIGRFLIQSLQFAMMDDFVCLMHDAVTARSLSAQRKQKLGETESDSSGSIPGSPRIRNGKLTSNLSLISPSQFPTVGETRKKYDHRDVESLSSSSSTSRVASPASSLNGATLSLTSIASSIPLSTAGKQSTFAPDSLPASDTSTRTTHSPQRTNMSPHMSSSMFHPSQLSSSGNSTDLPIFPSLHDSNSSFILPFNPSASQNSQGSAAIATSEDLSQHSDLDDLDESVMRDSLKMAEGVAQEAADDIRDEFRVKVQATAAEANPEDNIRMYHTAPNDVQAFKAPVGGGLDSFGKYPWRPSQGDQTVSSQSTPVRASQVSSVAQANSLPGSPNRPIYSWSLGSEQSKLFSTWDKSDLPPGGTTNEQLWSAWNTNPEDRVTGSEFLSDLSRAADKEESPVRDIAEVMLPSCGVIGSRPGSQTATPPVSDRNSQSPAVSVASEPKIKSTMLDDVDDDDDDNSSPIIPNTSGNSSVLFGQIPRSVGDIPAPISSLWSNNVNSPFSLGLGNTQAAYWKSGIQNIDDSLTEKIDDEFTKEMSASIHNELRQHEAFQGDPNLLRNIMSVIEKDVTASKHRTESENVKRMVEVGVNTEEDPYKTKWITNVQQLNSLSSLHQETLDRLAKLQNTTATEIQQLKEKLAELADQNKVMSGERDKIKAQYTAEAQAWCMDRNNLKEQIKLQRTQIKSMQEIEKTVNCQMNEKDEEIHKLNDSLMQKSEEQRQALKTLLENNTEQKARAETAEAAVLQLKLDVGLQILDKALKDGDHHISNITQVLNKLNEQNMSNSQLQALLKTWLGTVDKVKKIKAEAIVMQLQMAAAAHMSRMPPSMAPPPPRAAAADAHPMLQYKAAPTIPVGMPPVRNLPPGLGLTPSRTPTPPGLQGASGGAGGWTKITGGTKVQTRNSFMDVMEKLSKLFPNYTTAELNRFIQDVRASRGGSLSGLGIDEVVALAANKILSRQAGGMRPSHAPSGLSTFGMTASGREATPQCEEEEDPCVICHEEMTPHNFIYLECRHRFHDNCIRKWLNEQSTCPTCRVHALLPDEFPSLK